MNDELDSRRQRLEELSGQSGPLSSRSPQASVENRKWFGDDGRPTPVRSDLHQRLVDDYFAESPNVPANRQAVIIVGPPGAGKSGVRADILRDSGTTPDQWRHLDPDDFRDRLAGAMVQDGTIGELVPPEVAEQQPTPRELSSQLFVESAKLSTRAQNEAIARGDNLIIEGTYSDPKRLGSLVKTLEKKGYDVHLTSVDVSPPDAHARTQDRYRTEALKAAEPGARGQNALGGRVVPAESLAGHFDETGNAKATAVAQQVAADRPAVQSVRQYSVAGADQPAELASVAQRQGGMRPVDAELYRVSRAAGMTEALPRSAGPAASGTGQLPDKRQGLQQQRGQQQGQEQGGQQQGGQRQPWKGSGQGERPDHLQRQQGGRGAARER